MQRKHRKVCYSEILRAVDLVLYKNNGSKASQDKLTCSFGSTTPPLAFGSIEQELAVSINEA